MCNRQVLMLDALGIGMTYMFIDTSHDETVHLRLEWISHECSHESNGSLKALMLNHRIGVDHVSRTNEGARYSWVGRCQLELAKCLTRTDRRTYSKKIGDPSKLVESWELILSHVSLDLLGNIHGHVLEGLRVFSESVFIHQTLNTGITKLLLGSAEGYNNSQHDGKSLVGV